MRKRFGPIHKEIQLECHFLSRLGSGPRPLGSQQASPCVLPMMPSGFRRGLVGAYRVVSGAPAQGLRNPRRNAPALCPLMKGQASLVAVPASRVPGGQHGASGGSHGPRVGGDGPGNRSEPHTTAGQLAPAQGLQRADVRHLWGLHMKTPGPRAAPLQNHHLCLLL